MLISPPFLPSPVEGESDEAFIERAMQGGAPGKGGYPLSFDLNWHGGIHLEAPNENGITLPVRAIADGKLVYLRQPLKEADVPLDHGLRYQDGWTDNGCLVLEHKTEIGEGAHAQVVFYSIYMHLSKIEITEPTIGKKIYRKEVLGKAGCIYGKKNLIHFEVIADDSQILNLVGRRERLLSHQVENGRTDRCWGDMYFFIPPEVLVYEMPPTNRLLTENTFPIAYRCPDIPSGSTPIQEGGSSQPEAPLLIQGYPWEVAHSLQEGIFVRMNYDRGQCTMSSFLITGHEIGLCKEEADYEYNLYKTATRLYPGCPSAGYELLRFGRVLGPDALQPANAAHWRKISLPSPHGQPPKTGWVNLNAPTVTKFSDADFPHWQGWKLIDDDKDFDSHCQSPYIRNILRLNDGNVVSDQVDAVSIAQSPSYLSLSDEEKIKLSERYESERKQNQAALKSSDTQQQIKRLICKFPTEWSSDDLDTRYGWLRKVAPGGPLTEERYERFRKHNRALAFWEDAALEGIEAKHWHFPPKEFIKTFRKCGWLSEKELTQLIPKHIIRKPGSHNSNTQGFWEEPNIAIAKGFIRTHKENINKTLQKFLITTPIRQACFFGNSTQETRWFRDLRESNGNNPDLHLGWYGRGLLQLTNPNGSLAGGNNNYYKYFKFLGRTPTTPPNQLTIQWRDEIGTSSFHATHSAGAYWVWPDKSTPTQSNPNRPQVDNTNKYADTHAENIRKTIATNSGIKTWYYNQSFVNCATAVNYPAVTGSNSPNMNGLVDRSVAYINALIILSDIVRFPREDNSTTDHPENYSRREI